MTDIETPSYKDYLSLLHGWTQHARKYLYTPPDMPGIECYGTGYNSWGVQTQQKAFSAFAVLASLQEEELEKAGMSRGELLDHSLKMLRFSLETHIEGSFMCLDGTKWGHTWISMLGIERMMHGIDAIKEHIADGDAHLLKKVMISESDWLMDKYYRSCPDEPGRIKAGPVENNDPENNIWAGAHLLRTALMYPQSGRAAEYVEKGTAFMLNGISVPSDAESGETVNGKKVSEWHEGNNFFESFALNHHRYLNVGYMAICLSNIAMLHFTYRIMGMRAPAFIYRHAEELWRLLKLCTFADGRFCRIGGDSRVRYCYCQDYAIPVWLMAADVFGDTDCASFEKGWLHIVGKEVSFNGDGSFLSRRCSGFASVSPLYYTRIESDRAATLAMGVHWRRLLDISPADKGKKTTFPEQPWHDSYHGACMQRGEKRIASFCWEASLKPQGMCVPAQRSDMAEWRWNCAGMLTGTGNETYHDICSREEYLFRDGFTTAGRTRICSRGFIEGQTLDILALHRIVFTALPDDRTVLVMQKCTAESRVYIKEIKGLMYNMPNDIFNDSIRTYHYDGGSLDIAGAEGGEKGAVELTSDWINVDGCLGISGIYGSDSFHLVRPGIRQAGLSLKLSQYERQVISTGLWADEICYPYKSGLIDADAGSVIYDVACVILAGADAEETALFSRENIIRPILEDVTGDIRAIALKAHDGRCYLQVANFGEHAKRFTLNVSGFTSSESLTGNTSQHWEKCQVSMELASGAADTLILKK